MEDVLQKMLVCLEVDSKDNNVLGRFGSCFYKRRQHPTSPQPTPPVQDVREVRNLVQSSYSATKEINTPPHPVDNPTPTNPTMPDVRELRKEVQDVKTC